jgi:hypothetical protein
MSALGDPTVAIKNVRFSSKANMSCDKLGVCVCQGGDHARFDT